MKKSIPFLALGLLAVSSAALAHTAWLEAVPGQSVGYRVLFGGHAGKLETLDPAKAKTIEAIDAKGSQLKVTRTVDREGLLLQVDGSPALITMHYDNGIHSRTATGPSIAKAMNEVPGAVSAQPTRSNTTRPWSPGTRWSPVRSGSRSKSCRWTPPSRGPANRCGFRYA